MTVRLARAVKHRPQAERISRIELHEPLHDVLCQAALAHFHQTANQPLAGVEKWLIGRNVDCEARRIFFLVNCPQAELIRIAIVTAGELEVVFSNRQIAE